ncbi:MAG: carbohydrate kinase [Caulobacteraceae bacterium]
MPPAVATLDVGKTRSKLAAWTLEGWSIARFVRDNPVRRTGGLRRLDIEGIEAWLFASLAELARQTQIVAIAPAAHGAAAVLMRGASPILALDYEQPPPADIAFAYEVLRDPFEATLSPRLSGGLNLGLQLYWLESLFPGLWPDAAEVLLWPQYWAWRLCGERACETTSLGCHSDLWRPLERRFSNLAEHRGWSSRLGPIRRADAILGSIRPDLAVELGLPRHCRICCGIHDTNAALHAARALLGLENQAFSLVSTGTWFVCLSVGSRMPACYDPAGAAMANVDIFGEPTPTARFMGGRDYERSIGAGPDAEADLARRTLAALEAIGAEGPIVVEGRFASDDAFIEALARLDPDREVRAFPRADGVALGALRLAVPDLPCSAFTAPEPLYGSRGASR